MNDGYLQVKQSSALCGEVTVSGAKNAVLVIIASLVLTKGISLLYNVPVSSDVLDMIEMLRCLGAVIIFDKKSNILSVDTSNLSSWSLDAILMRKTRASILFVGPLLARFGKAQATFPGGDAIGKRPIDYHLKNLKKMGVDIFINDNNANQSIYASVDNLKAAYIVLEYPSVGATENILMAATKAQGTTTIINAACEPEVLDLIEVLRKMGACIQMQAPATIIVKGVSYLNPIEYNIMPDRLEVGSLLLAAAATKGEITIPNVQANVLDVFLFKLEEMGHVITLGENRKGIHFKATQYPNAVSFKTGPYPSFPTDLQAPMMALQCLAQGISIIEETVFENRFQHISQLIKMGASITVDHNKAIITGVERLYGAEIIATDIRASTALVIAGLMAQGKLG